MDTDKIIQDLNRRDIFCSSIPGYGIPNGANIFDFLRERFLNYDLHIIFVHSPEYYESPVNYHCRDSKRKCLLLHCIFHREISEEETDAGQMD